MAQSFRKAMDALYLACVVVAGVALVLISAVIPWAVFTRYVLNSASSWPEPTAVLLTIVLTFFGAAACYRLRLHMNVSLVVNTLPARYRRVTDFIVWHYKGHEWPAFNIADAALVVGVIGLLFDLREAPPWISRDQACPGG